MSKIYDAHSHYMPPEIGQNTAFFKVGWSDAERQLGVMDELGIEKSLLLYPTSDAHLNMGGWATVADVYNSKIRDVVKVHADRFMGGFVIPYGNVRGRDEELTKFDPKSFKVFSLASSYDGVYLDDDYFEPVFEFAQKHGVPVHVHPQILNPIGSERIEDPLLSPVLEYVFDVSMCLGKLMMSGTFIKFPDVKFIFAHYGGVLPVVKERFDNTYQMLRRREFVKDLGKLPGDYFKNCYFDTSGSKSPASLLCALEVTDPSHIMFGSDYPANQNIPGALDVLGEVGRSPQETELMKYLSLQNLVF